MYYKGQRRAIGLGFLICQRRIEAQGSEVGMKSKTEGLDGSKEGKVENEKKQKVEEETKTLSMLFATHLGVAKVAKQPRQPQ